jgi:putative ABC transport system substrate-binding protein
MVASLIREFEAGLRDLGYVSGDTIDIQYRSVVNAPEEAARVALEMASLPVDAIIATGGATLVAARQAPQSIPVVVAASGDVVKTGLVLSLARPGGNITGLTSMSANLAAKRLELLAEAVPGLTRISTIWNPAEAVNIPELEESRVGARRLNLELQAIEAARVDALPDAFAAAHGPRSALILFAHVFVTYNRGRFMEHASQFRVPTMYGLAPFVREGGQISYGPDLRILYRRAATYVDKILKGANPAHLPIEQPTEFELVINVKTAQALGLAIPQSVLQRATEIIQ